MLKSNHELELLYGLNLKQGLAEKQTLKHTPPEKTIQHVL